MAMAMAMKVSYNGQIHRVHPPEDYDSLLSTVTNKYPSLSSKPLHFYYIDADNKVPVQNTNYKDLLPLDRSVKMQPLKIFVELDETPKPEAQKIEDQAEQTTQAHTNEVRLSDVQERASERENTEKQDSAVKEQKQHASIEEIEALQGELLVSMDDMVYITRVFNVVKERVLNKSHAFAAFLVFKSSAPNYLRLELQTKLSETFETNSYELIKDKHGLVMVTEHANGFLKALEIIQEWSASTNININTEKSALIEFLPRRARKLELTSPKILEIPVLKEYHYKGILLDQKLMFQKQISNVRQKALEITKKMEGSLEELSFEARVEAWREFIEPLFESILPIYEAEEAVSRKNELEALVRVTFRRMAGLEKNHSTEEVENTIGYSLQERAQKVVGLYRESWSAKH